MTENPKDQKDRRCGTCKWFGSKKPQGHKRYLCRFGPVPIWAEWDDRYLYQYMGRSCETWEARE